MAFNASVVPCTTSPTSCGDTPARSIRRGNPRATDSEGSSGTLGSLKRTSCDESPDSTKSVNVPPTSMPMRQGCAEFMREQLPSDPAPYPTEPQRRPGPSSVPGETAAWATKYQVPLPRKAASAHHAGSPWAVEKDTHSSDS